MAKNKYLNKQELELFNSVAPIFTAKQMEIINQRTPPSEVEEKKEDVKIIKSVKAPYMKKLVTIITGGNYTFEIKEQVYLAQSKEIRTTARLTIYFKDGTYFREQNGKAKCNAPNANSFKSSASDAFKKCASEFGFCWDIYGNDDEIEVKDSPVKSYPEQKEFERYEKMFGNCKTTYELETRREEFEEQAGKEKWTDEMQKLFDSNMIRILNNH